MPAELSSFWEARRPIWKQVHGTAWVEVKTPSQSCGDVDALFTAAKNVPIGVITADCVPILMCHLEGHAVAAVHAGWRGTRGHILKELWDELLRQGHQPQEWIAAVGPAIGPCCYQVSDELAKDFARKFADLGQFGFGDAVPRERILDLPSINAAELKRIGLAQVDVLRICTLCSTKPRFHSYRREGSASGNRERRGGRQYSLIVKKPATEKMG